LSELAIAADVGESLLPSLEQVSELGVVETQETQDRGVQKIADFATDGH